MSHIPDPVKRQLRQEAGFGCCRCGIPIIEYHHIIERSVEDHNRPEDMMAVCPTFHSEITAGAVPEPEQRRWKTEPHNLARGFVDGALKSTTEYPIVVAGPNDFVNNGPLITVNGETLLGLTVEDGYIAVTLNLYDEHDNLLLAIDRNEWISGDPLAWDIEATHQHLIIRTKSGDVRLRLHVRELIVVSADLRRSGRRIQLTPSGFRLDAELAQDVQWRGFAFIGQTWVVDDDVVMLSTNPRYKRSAFRASGGDRLEDHRAALEILKQLEQEVGWAD